MQYLNHRQIWELFISNTLLPNDRHLWGYGSCRWTAESVCEKLVEHGYLKIADLYSDGKIFSAYLLKPISNEEIEKICLGKIKHRRFLDYLKRGIYKRGND